MQNNLPFQAVEIGDHNGFMAALYAVNALYKRCGMECTDTEKTRKSVYKIVKKATPENVSLLLREWYSMPVEESEVQKVLDNLPEQILNNDDTRYVHGSLVRGIEWSAVATIFRCSIAVKIISKESYQKYDGNRCGVEWKVAVPSPNIFGLSGEANAGPATACVFILTHQGETQKYYPLIPSKQFVFEPGKPLVLNPNDFSSSKAARTVSQDQDDDKKGNSAPLQKGSSSKSQQPVNAKKKQVHFIDENIRRGNTEEKYTHQRPEKSTSDYEKYVQTDKRQNSNLSALTSRGFHPKSSMRLLKDNEIVMRSETYTKVEKTTKERNSELSESSTFLNTVYREAKRNEREISCLEIYDRVYHGEM